jgi:pilus assembly protein Flp/PilA
MRDVVKLVKKLGADEEGAALIEYTVLLGILLVAVIATIGLVANWVSGKWSNLQGNLP